MFFKSVSGAVGRVVTFYSSNERRNDQPSFVQANGELYLTAQDGSGCSLRSLPLL